MLARVFGEALRRQGALRWLPWLALGAAGLLASVYAREVGLGLVLGDVTSAQNWLHEFFHDFSHSAAIQCH